MYFVVVKGRKVGVYNNKSTAVKYTLGYPGAEILECDNLPELSRILTNSELSNDSILNILNNTNLNCRLVIDENGGRRVEVKDVESKNVEINNTTTYYVYCVVKDVFINRGYRVNTLVYDGGDKNSNLLHESSTFVKDKTVANINDCLLHYIDNLLFTLVANGKVIMYVNTDNPSSLLSSKSSNRDLISNIASKLLDNKVKLVLVDINTSKMRNRVNTCRNISEQ